MKIFKILIVMITCLFLSSNLFAEIRDLEKVEYSDMLLHRMCIDGYKFVVVQEDTDGKGSLAVSVTQIFEQTQDGENSVPAKCF